MGTDGQGDSRVSTNRLLTLLDSFALVTMAPLSAFPQDVTLVSKAFGTSTDAANGMPGDAGQSGLGAVSAVVAFAFTDADRDRMDDDWEVAHGLNLEDGKGDPDRDGLSNRQEFKLGTNPQSEDSDGDGTSDERRR